MSAVENLKSDAVMGVRNFIQAEVGAACKKLSRGVLDRHCTEEKTVALCAETLAETIVTIQVADNMLDIIDRAFKAHVDADGAKE